MYIYRLSTLDVRVLKQKGPSKECNPRTALTSRRLPRRCLSTRASRVVETMPKSLRLAAEGLF